MWSQVAGILCWIEMQCIMDKAQSKPSHKEKEDICSYYLPWAIMAPSEFGASENDAIVWNIGYKERVTTKMINATVFMPNSTLHLDDWEEAGRVECDDVGVDPTDILMAVSAVLVVPTDYTDDCDTDYTSALLIVPPFSTLSNRWCEHNTLEII